MVEEQRQLMEQRLAVEQRGRQIAPQECGWANVASHESNAPPPLPQQRRGLQAGPPLPQGSPTAFRRRRPKEKVIRVMDYLLNSERAPPARREPLEPGMAEEDADSERASESGQSQVSGGSNSAGRGR